VGTILNQIYEEDFLGFSYGFRPGRSPHDALAFVESIEKAAPFDLWVNAWRKKWAQGEVSEGVSSELPTSRKWVGSCRLAWLPDCG